MGWEAVRRLIGSSSYGLVDNELGVSWVWVGWLFVSGLVVVCVGWLIMSWVWVGCGLVVVWVGW